MRKLSLISVVILSIIALTPASCGPRHGTIGSKENPVRFYFMPLKGTDAFQQNAPLITAYLEANTGLKVQAIAAPDFVTIVKAFGNKQADIAFMNTLGYLMARDWAKAEAHLMQIYGDIYRTYRGEFITQVGSKVNTPADLNGKTIAFGDPFSASGYLYALKFLRDNKITPAKTLFAGGHKQAVQMVYDGRADAAATYHSRPSTGGLESDARAELLSLHKDVFDKIKIIALTDEIPSGPVALRYELPVDIKAKLVGALIEFARTSDGRASLSRLYNITGFALTSDAEYDGVQKVIRDLGKSVEEVVPGGVTFYMTRISPLLEN